MGDDNDERDEAHQSMTLTARAHWRICRPAASWTKIPHRSNPEPLQTGGAGVATTTLAQSEEVEEVSW